MHANDFSDDETMACPGAGGEGAGGVGAGGGVRSGTDGSAAGAFGSAAGAFGSAVGAGVLDVAVDCVIPAGGSPPGSGGTASDDRSKRLRPLPADVQELMEKLSGMSLEQGCFAAAGRLLGSGDPQQRLAAARDLRIALSIAGEIPIQEIVETPGVVAALVRFLAEDGFPQLQFEAAWALTNIASGSHAQTARVVEAGAVPHFLRLLRHPAEDVREQALWALGNVAGDGAEFRDLILRGERLATIEKTARGCGTPFSFANEETPPAADGAAGGGAGDIANGGAPATAAAGAASAAAAASAAGGSPLPSGATPPPLAQSTGGAPPPSSGMRQIVGSCERSASLATVRTGLWCISNLCRGRPRPVPARVAAALPYLLSALASLGDGAALADACWALDGLSEAAAGVAALAAAGPAAARALARALAWPDPAVQRPALRVAGQVAAGTVEQTNFSLPFLDAYGALLDSPRAAIRRDACWAVSNVAAGTAAQLAALLARPGLVERLVAVARFDAEPEVRKEAAWALCNACTSERPPQLAQLLAFDGLLFPVVEMLASEDWKVVDVALDAAANVLEYAAAHCGGSWGAAAVARHVDLVQRLADLRGAGDAPATFAVLAKAERLWGRVVQLMAETEGAAGAGGEASFFGSGEAGLFGGGKGGLSALPRSAHARPGFAAAAGGGCGFNRHGIAASTRN